MSTMKENVAKLVTSVEMTAKEDFPKTPRGYSQRTNACLIQLCLHADRAVRLACATSPLLRDMFVIAMHENEQDAEIKTILSPLYLAAVSKDHMRDTLMAAKDEEITSLKALLAKRNRKNTRK